MFIAKLNEFLYEMKKRWIDLLSGNRLFRGIEEKDMPEVLSFLQAEERKFRSGEAIIRFGDSVRKAGVLLSGKARIVFYDEADNPITIKLLSAGDTFGHVAVCEGCCRSPFELVALSDCRILTLDLMPVIEGDADSCALFSRISSNLIKDISEHAAFLNMRLRIIGQKRIKDRLKVYLGALPREKDGSITISVSMTDLAAFLNMDRSALYREIRMLKKQGILIWDQRTVRILDKEYLK